METDGPINPAALAPPTGFSHGVLRTGTLLSLAGQNGSDAEGAIVAPGDFVAQAKQALRNLLTVVEAAGGTPRDVVKLVFYVRDVEAYRAARPALGGVWRELFGRYYPAMTLVEVAGLLDPQATVEIDGLAVIADAPTAP